MGATIIGTGRMARGIATRLLAGGRNVTLRDLLLPMLQGPIGTGYMSTLKIRT